MHTKNNIGEDARFTKILHDPKFKKLPKRNSKVKIDKRFQSMFTDKAFQVTYSVDKRGRRISKTTNEDLHKFYHLSSDGSDSDERSEDDRKSDKKACRKRKNSASVPSLTREEEDTIQKKQISGKVRKKLKDMKVDERGCRISKTTNEDLHKFNHLSSDGSDSDERLEDDRKSDKKACRKRKNSTSVPFLTREEEDMIQKKQISGKVRKKLKDMKVDYARGEAKLFSESSSDEESSEDEESEVIHEWNELHKDAETTETTTKRLAVCNMDWDRVKAVDLMALFRSFLPPLGAVLSVAIYPSEFGLQRLAEEEIKGPAELVTVKNDSASEDESDDSDADDGDEGKQYRMERMREYQLNRLKYYYAVATFDSPQTADKIYNECNGFEYGKSGILLDLRVIDDDTTFEHEPKDFCDSINLQKYKPLDFVNTALQQTKVELTWDETDPQRRELTQHITEAAKKGDINDSDLEDLVALSSSDDEEEDDILEALKKNSTPEEFGPFEQLLEKRNAFKKKKKEQKKREGTEDAYVEDDKDDRKKKKSKELEINETQKGELELLSMDQNNEDKNKPHFNLKRKKHKFKKDKNKPSTDDFEVDVNDERFSALYTSHEFNIDPTKSNYSKTKGMQAFVLEKQKRLSKNDSSVPVRVVPEQVKDNRTIF